MNIQAVVEIFSSMPFVWAYGGVHASKHKVKGPRWSLGTSTGLSVSTFWQNNHCVFSYTSLAIERFTNWVFQKRPFLERFHCVEIRSGRKLAAGKGLFGASALLPLLLLVTTTFLPFLPYVLFWQTAHYISPSFAFLPLFIYYIS